MTTRPSSELVEGRNTLTPETARELVEAAKVRERVRNLRPQYRGVVLQDGHIDRITGPRCMVKMSEGPNRGKYVIAQTTEVLREGTPVSVDWLGSAAAIERAEKEMGGK